MLSGLESLLEIVSLEMMTKSVRAGTHSTSCRERVLDFGSCNAEAAGAKFIAHFGVELAALLTTALTIIDREYNKKASIR